MTIHNAVAYMYAMRRGGAQLMVIFRSLSENANIYGEVALEFRQVVRDADFFGYDVVTALKHLIETSPSEKLKDFLEDLLSVIESGGDMAGFLSMRVRLYQEEARFEQKQFLNFLSLIAESYVTLFVAGPLFLIIIMVVMGMIGSGAMLQFTAVTYAVLPIGSLVFILIIDVISLKTERAERYRKGKWLHEYDEVIVVKKDGEENLFAQLAHYDKWRNIINQLKHPLQGFIMDVNRTFYITIPVALFYIAMVYFNTPYYRDIEIFINVIDDHVIVALLIVMIPYGIFYEMWGRKILGLEDLIPDFLERMANINKVGLTIAQSIGILVNTNLGLLSYEIKRIKRDMDWGAHFSEALIRFEDRVRTPLIARTVTLITKASEMSGQIGEVLTIAASDAKMSWILKRERISDMFIYTAVVYLSFLVFLFVIAVLTTQFLPVLANVSSQGGGNIAMGGAFSGIGKVSIITFKRLLYHSCLIQGLFSGLIAGQLGESSVAAGIKHACIMLIISMVAFNFIL
jgi:flagellar protein FlaJ